VVPHSCVFHINDKQRQENYQTMELANQKTYYEIKLILYVLDYFRRFTLISEKFSIILMVVYRTSMQIVADLLVATDQCGQEGIKTTSLLSKANLSHSRLEKFVSNLTGAGLVNKIEYDGKNVFVITPKGRQYLEQYQKFSDVAESFGLEM